MENFVENLFSKIIRYEVSTLAVFDNDIIFDDLKVLASSAKRVYLFENTIKYKNGTIVMFDKILGCLSTNIESFFFWFRKDIPMVDSSTMKNILQLRNLQNLKGFNLKVCPDTLSIEDLSAFLKKFKNTEIILCFASNISEEYKEQLDYLIDEIIESDVTNRLIKYDGQDEEKLQIMINQNGNFLKLWEDDEDEDGFDVETESDAGSTSSGMSLAEGLLADVEEDMQDLKPKEEEDDDEIDEITEAQSIAA
uniref:Uncharacterized protein n=1 Tax=Panagrolaimus davidi TaxID=227884 RepID=A0A914PA27_9BILA